MENNLTLIAKGTYSLIFDSEKIIVVEISCSNKTAHINIHVICLSICLYQSTSTCLCHIFRGLQQTIPEPHTPAGDKDTPRAPVGLCVPHKSSTLQVTGEAVYTDDIPSPRGTLHGALVMSTRAHANIVSIDTSAAEACPGFEVREDVSE